MNEIKVLPGIPLPYGASHTPQGINFSLFSKSASTVSLVLFVQGTNEIFKEILLDKKINKTGSVWHICLKGLSTCPEYSYRIEGDKNTQENGSYFNSSKLLIDPYVKSIRGFYPWGKRDDPALIPRGVAVFPKYDWEGDKPLNRSLSETIIYEVHSRGFTKNSNSKVNKKGTFKALKDKIPYLKELGITAIELMPIHEFDEMFCPFSNPDTGEQLLNYWGYSTIGFFALKSAYCHSKSPSQQINEFRDLVKALHKAGIEVILDVVFNHTGEGANHYEPVYSFKGIERSVYYMLDQNGQDTNYSGCGNTMNCNHPVVRNMITDSLRYWVTEMHVDGFRFDLASILGRDQNGSVLENPPLIESIAKDPVLAETKIIAEAWDAAGLYQVGSFPASQRWAEWNDRYRDTVRRFVRGEKGFIADLATRIAGSEDLYFHSNRKPYHSINFITAHDGFTMMDLVSFSQKNNLDNGEENRDGTNENYSYNFGTEGKTRKFKINKLRHQQIRNMAAILLISAGTPMLLSGDEFGRTKAGNNNTWCQDNKINWLDWKLLEKNKKLFLFWKKMIAFRKKYSGLKRENFYTGRDSIGSGIPDISWHGVKPNEPDFFSGKSRTMALTINGGLNSKKQLPIIYVAMNFESEETEFELPVLWGTSDWNKILDTTAPDEFIQDKTQKIKSEEQKIKLSPFSIQILIKNILVSGQ